MGQAKQRGTFDQRQQAAYGKVDQLDAARAENLKALEGSEKQSEGIMKTAVSQFIVNHWDRTNLKQRIPAAAFNAITPETFNPAVAEMAAGELAKLIVEDAGLTPEAA